MSVPREGEVLCFLADVSGHGPEASALARELERRFTELVGRPCARILTALNELVDGRWPTDQFASAICFAYDTWTGRGTVAVAGHLPPIVKRGMQARPLDVWSSRESR